MENIYEWAKIAVAVTAIITPISILVGKWMNHGKRIAKCEENNTSICKSLNQLLKENKIVITGVLACLQGLKEQGCNGTVTTSIDLINDFINETAHKEI